MARRAAFWAWQAEALLLELLEAAVYVNIASRRVHTRNTEAAVYVSMAGRKVNGSVEAAVLCEHSRQKSDHKECGAGAEE
jgi:hypothetical protein